MRYEQAVQTDAPALLQVPPVHAVHEVIPAAPVKVPAPHETHLVRFWMYDPGMQTKEHAGVVPRPMKTVKGDWFKQLVHAVELLRA